MNRYRIEAGDIVDHINARTEEEALELWAQDAGYATYAALEEVAPGKPDVTLVGPALAE